MLKAFFDFGLVRLVMALGLIGVYGWFAYWLWVLVVRTYLGDGDWKKGLGKFAASVLVVWFSVWVVHLSAYWLWSVTPGASSYNAVVERFQLLCTVEIQDDETQGHREIDWHAGDEVCAPLNRQVNRLYPGPTWLFGNRPSGDGR
jgi:hypothetical protein